MDAATDKQRREGRLISLFDLLDQDHSGKLRMYVMSENPIQLLHVDLISVCL
jgi:hypothetical protein